MTSTGSDLGEVFGGGHNFSTCGVDILQASSHHEHRLLSSHWRLDIRIRLVTQRLDFATFTKQSHLLHRRRIAEWLASLGIMHKDVGSNPGGAK